MNQKKITIAALALMAMATTGFAQVKISGYVQGQFQYGEPNAALKVGTANDNTDEDFNRIGLRRGRVKFTAENGIASGVFQLDITEKGLGIKDAYLTIKDKWQGIVAVKAGIFDRPFGYEISYSSSQRESPERSTIFQTLFPDERDLGAMITLQAPSTSAWSILKLEAGLFAGNGIKLETDNEKDFIGHLSASKSIDDNFKFGVGVSYYNGKVYKNAEQFVKREYFGFDAQLAVISVLGMTKLHGEYLFGSQPGSRTSSKSPNASTLPAADTYNYMRDFAGGYVMLVQDFGTLPLSAVVKYDVYDPNAKLKGNDIGLNDSGVGDVSFNTLGFGLLWRANSNIRLQAFYEMVTNEKSNNLANYASDRKDNVFTLRLQYKF
ncbi:MAG: OprO/OprP family phosphate-selective porin [Bacteroidales bacterium]|jgi:phosphate-selective porin|nr:OprO/OprP family phosphate-selective porin [Bacteroidales bacterium]